MFKEDGLSDTNARRLAQLPIAALTPDILYVADRTGNDVSTAARAFFAVTSIFKIGRLEHLAERLDTEDYFDSLAQMRALDTIHYARNAITAAALSGNKKDPEDAVVDWVEANKTRISRVQERISDLTGQSELTVSRLTVAAGLLTDLVG